jgi:hypothetical protein
MLKALSLLEAEAMAARAATAKEVKKRMVMGCYVKTEKVYVQIIE